VRLGGRRVLVTGAASGIGLAAARLFRQEGAQVAMLERDEIRLKAAAVEDAVPLVCDVADERQVREAVAQAASALGGLDGVVNSAGILPDERRIVVRHRRRPRRGRRPDVSLSSTTQALPRPLALDSSSATISGRIRRPETSTRATVTGSVNRRGPALPGLR
jgi:NAD(P)-dependent dehydrogenase (short-subunit alcohol dehydrogenase family)